MFTVQSKKELRDGVEILFDDGRVLAAFKPGRMPTTKDPNKAESLQEIVNEEINILNHFNFRPAYQIDCELTGVVLGNYSDRNKSHIISANTNNEILYFYMGIIRGDLDLSEPKHVKKKYLSDRDNRKRKWISDKESQSKESSLYLDVINHDQKAATVLIWTHESSSKKVRNLIYHGRLYMNTHHLFDRKVFPQYGLSLIGASFPGMEGRELVLRPPSGISQDCYNDLIQDIIRKTF